MKIYLISLVFFTFSFSVLSDVYLKTANPLDSQALCLNAQPAFLYYQQNAEPAAKGLIIYFMSNPSSLFCGNSSVSASLDNCISTLAELNAFWEAKLNIDSGMLVDNQYKSWAKVIVPHCDGALYQGYSKNPTKYKGLDLYFRGNKIIRSNFMHITQKYNLSKLQNVVLAGSGLGAIGALIWARHFRDQHVLESGNAKFELILDSYPSFYPSFKSGKDIYRMSLQNMMKLSNVDDSHPFVLCALRNEGQEERCFDFEQTYPYTNFPIIAISSQYDLFTIARVLQIDCINAKGSLGQCTSLQRQYIEKHRTDRMVALFRFTNFRDNSFWSIACPAGNLLNQAYSSSTLTVRGVNVNSAVNFFIGGSRCIDFDRNSWPGNSDCSNTP